MMGLQGGFGQNNLISSGLKIGSSSQSAPGLERDSGASSVLNTVWGVPPWRCGPGGDESIARHL